MYIYVDRIHRHLQTHVLCIYQYIYTHTYAHTCTYMNYGATKTN